MKTASTVEGTLPAGGEKSEWEQIDLCNNDIVKSFYKNKLLPNHKFLGPEQLKYMDYKRSLCFKIYAEIEIPDTIKTHVDKIFYWNQRYGQVRVEALWISLHHQLENQEQGKTFS